jgi:hypothetical protein
VPVTASAARRAPGPGRLAIQFGVAFALAMLAMGVIVFLVAEERIAQRIDDALQVHVTKFCAPLPRGRQRMPMSSPASRNGSGARC